MELIKIRSKHNLQELFDKYQSNPHSLTRIENQSFYTQLSKVIGRFTINAKTIGKKSNHCNYIIRIPEHMDTEDLIQDGVVYILERIQKNDSSKGSIINFINFNLEDLWRTKTLPKDSMPYTMSQQEFKKLNNLERICLNNSHSDESLELISQINHTYSLETQLDKQRLLTQTNLVNELTENELIIYLNHSGHYEPIENEKAYNMLRTLTQNKIEQIIEKGNIAKNNPYTTQTLNQKQEKIKELMDNGITSNSAIAKELGLSRSGVWKLRKDIKELQTKQILPGLNNTRDKILELMNKGITSDIEIANILGMSRTGIRKAKLGFKEIKTPKVKRKLSLVETQVLEYDNQKLNNSQIGEILNLSNEQVAKYKFRGKEKLKSLSVEVA